MENKANVEQSQSDVMKIMTPKIWNLFRYVKAVDAHSSGEYYLVLLLLSLYKDRIINKTDTLDLPNIKHAFLQLLYNANKWHFDDPVKLNTYSQVVPEYIAYVENLEDKTISGLVHSLLDIDIDFLSDNFSEVFEDVLGYIVTSTNTYPNAHIQPEELTMLIFGLADLQNEAKIYNPFAGMASYGLCLSDSQTYYGQEVNNIIYATGLLRLMAHNKHHNATLVLEDSIIHWGGDNKNYDLVVASPPFKFRLGADMYLGIETYRELHEFYLGESLEILNSTGKMIGLFTAGSLSAGEKHVLSMYRSFIENDYLDMVISMPGGMFPNSGVITAILVLNKNKQYPGKVRFVKGEHFVTEQKNKVNKLLDADLLNYIASNKSDSEYIRFIANKEIADNDFSLIVNKYYKVPVIEGTPLGEFIQNYLGDRALNQSIGKHVRIRDLSDANAEINLDTSSIESEEITRRDIREINQSCLLLSSQWRAIKPTYFEYKGESIFIGHEIYAFHIDESKVTPEYIVHELRSDYVGEQFEQYRTGAAVPRFNRDAAHNIVVDIPASIDEQKSRLAGMNKILDRMSILERVLESKDVRLQQVVAEEYGEYASLKHTLGTPRQNIASSIYGLIYFFSKNPEGYELINQQFRDVFEIDIMTALMDIEKSINLITNILEKGEKGLVLSNYEKDIVPLSEISSLIQKLSDSAYNFKIERNVSQVNDEQQGVEINLVLLQVLLDNILMNANIHAFDKESTNNRVLIGLHKEDGYLKLNIKNNGKPFPEKYDREEYISKFNTSNVNIGSGLGGYDVHRIASYFENPDWSLLLDSPIYPVEFRFKFQIKPI